MTKRQSNKGKRDATFRKLTDPYKKPLKAIPDRVNFPMESNNKIWDDSVPERFKKAKGWR